MIRTCTGNLFEAKTQAMVNPVNCVGVMGKGLALQFKRRYPVVFQEYKQACDKGQVEIGRVHVVRLTQDSDPTQYIINFPTKQHWRDKSKAKDIIVGLQNLIKTVKDNNLTSIAVPALGCGLGGLDWATVEPMIEQAFALVPDVDVRVYGPEARNMLERVLIYEAKTGIDYAQMGKDAAIELAKKESERA